MLYKLNHRIGSYYHTQTSPTISAKNGINALRKALEYAKAQFKESENLDLRLVILGYPNFDYDKKPITDKYCIGICKFKENYFELELIKPKN